MIPFCTIQRLAPVILLLLLAPCCFPAATGIQVALGDTVPLSGYSTGSQWVYLFLTGPNLPVNGVQLNDVTKRADEGYFTRVDVDSNDHWSYKWSTADVGGRLDEGTYTVWVANSPTDLSHLSQADYRSISVTLGAPYVAIDTVPQYGGMDITSTPAGASVSLDNQFRGTTPLTLADIAPGTYQVTFSLEGYVDFSTPVRVESSRISEVAVNLAPLPRIPVSDVTTVAAETAPTSAATTTPPATTPKSSGLMVATAVLGLLVLSSTAYRLR